MARWFGFLLLLASLGVYFVTGYSDPAPYPDDIPDNPDGQIPPTSPPLPIPTPTTQN
jgi:hypothetical protein